MVTPLGATAQATVASWGAGVRAIRRRIPELAGTSLVNSEAAQLPDFDPAKRLGSRRMLKYMSRSAMLGCVSAHEAVEDADVRHRYAPERVGLFAGVGLAAAMLDDILPMLNQSIDEDGKFSCRLLGQRGLAVSNPLLSFKILANMPPCLISIIEGAKGPNYIFTPWEGQTAAALLEAWQAVDSGEVDCALVGAAEDAGHPATLVYLRQARLLSECELAGAGAAYVIMERAERAARDGVHMYARILSMSMRYRRSPGFDDPLAERMGRCFAAAPAMLTALACRVPGLDVRIRGTDEQEFQARLEILS